MDENSRISKLEEKSILLENHLRENLNLLQNVEETETKYLGTLQFTTKFNFADNILVVKILKVGGIFVNVTKDSFQFAATLSLS